MPVCQVPYGGNEGITQLMTMLYPGDDTLQYISSINIQLLTASG
jgi:hypothetical protein